MIKVKDIIWINKDIGEADVVITDGKYEVICFAHPFNQKVGDEIFDTISVFESSNFEKSDKSIGDIRHLGNGRYFFVARLMDVEEGIVQIGEIVIHDIDGIPPNIKKDEFVQFIAERVDLW